MVRKCPPGILCIENYTLLFFALLIIAILYFMNIKYNQNLNKTHSCGCNKMSCTMCNKSNANHFNHNPSDLIPFSYEMPNNITNEWEFFDFYEKKNIEYLDQNLSRYLKDIIIKLKFIFFGINRDGALPDKNGNFDNSIRFSLILSKLLFNLGILYSFVIIFKNFKKIFSQKKEIFFLSLVILNLLPHIFVWATSKHLVAISNITMMYLIFCFAENKNKINL